MRIMLLSANEKSRYNREVHFGPVAQWLEQSTHNRLAAGSNPAGPTKISLNLNRIYVQSFAITTRFRETAPRTT